MSNTGTMLYTSYYLVLSQAHHSQSIVIITIKGVMLQVCDKLLQQHSKKRLKLQEKVETSKLIQRARVQARFDQQSEKIQGTNTYQQLHSKRMDVEKHFLV